MQGVHHTRPGPAGVVNVRPPGPAGVVLYKTCSKRTQTAAENVTTETTLNTMMQCHATQSVFCRYYCVCVVQLLLLMFCSFFSFYFPQ